MKRIVVALLVAVCPLAAAGQSSSRKPALPTHPNAPASQEVQTEKIAAPAQTPAVRSAPPSNSGYMNPAQVKALLHKIWLAEYRLNDLLTQVHPDRWKMQPAARQSFEQSLDSLRKAMAGEEGWRNQFGARPDSLYLGFQAYLAIGAVVPRVDGVARSVSQYENVSFGVQYSQSANQIHDLQQLLVPHLLYLLKNQDDAIQVAQTNLAACQNELNFAEHDKEGRAKPIKNIAPEFKGRRRNAHAQAAAGEKKSPPKGTPAGGGAAKQPNKPKKK